MGELLREQVRRLTCESSALSVSNTAATSPKGRGFCKLTILNDGGVLQIIFTNAYNTVAPSARALST